MIQLAFIANSGSSLGAQASQGPDLTRYLFVCALLIAGIGGLAYLFRRFVASKVTARAAKRSLQVMDMLPLGGKQRVCVVRCYDRTFALGLGDKEVSLIAELDAVIAPQSAQKKNTDVVAAQPATFAELLQRLKKTHAKTPTPATAEIPRKEHITSGGVLG